MAGKINSLSAKIKFSILIGIFVVLFLVALYFHSEGFNIKYLQSIDNYGKFPILFIFIYVILCFLPIPFAPTSFLGGFFFPFFDAFLYTLIGSMIFATTLFYFVRWLGRDYADYMLNKSRAYRKLKLHLGKRAFFDLLMLRLFFVIPPELVNIIAGLSSIRFRDYFFATLIGNSITIFLATAFIRTLTHDIWLFGIVILCFAIVFTIPVTFVRQIQKLLQRIFLRHTLKKHER